MFSFSNKFSGSRPSFDLGLSSAHLLG